MQAITGTMPPNEVVATPTKDISDHNNDHIGEKLPKVNISGII
jgi:hypothetical protein